MDNFIFSEEDLSQDGKKILKSINWNESENFLTLCEKRLEKEQRLPYIFSNKEVISDMGILIGIIKYKPKYQELVTQEKYHRDIVNKS